MAPAPPPAPRTFHVSLRIDQERLLAVTAAVTNGRTRGPASAWMREVLPGAQIRSSPPDHLADHGRWVVAAQPGAVLPMPAHVGARLLPPVARWQPDQGRC